MADKTFLALENQNENFNGDHIKSILEVQGDLTLFMSGGDLTFDVSEADEAYVRAYMAGQGFILLENIHWNPKHVLAVTSPEEGRAILYDVDGDIYEYTSAADIATFNAQAPNFVWVPTP